MATWGTVDLVRARVAYATISSTSKPTETQVTTWLDEAEAEIRGILSDHGLSTSYAAGSDAAYRLASWAVDYAEARCLIVWKDPLGQTRLSEFRATMEKLRDGAIKFGAELAGGDVAEAVRGARSYWTDNDDDLSIEDGDFDPAIPDDWKD